MVDDDMNYLGKAMIMGETNVIIDNETSINQGHDDMNYLVKAMIKCKTNLLATFYYKLATL